MTTKEKHKLNRDAGLCPTCGGERDREGSTYCERCVRFRIAYRADLRERRRKEGLCPTCGHKLGEEDEGFKRCAKCREYYKQETRRSRERRRKEAESHA